MFQALPKEKPDKLQIMALLGLMFIGAAFVYSATMVTPAEAEKVWYAQTWFRQVVWYLMGTGAAVTICFVDYYTLARWSYVFCGAMIGGLVAVLIPFICKTHGWGARR